MTDTHKRNAAPSLVWLLLLAACGGAGTTANASDAADVDEVGGEQPDSAAYANSSTGITQAVQDAMGENAGRRATAAAWLRQRGPQALGRLLAAGRELGGALRRDPSRATHPETARWREAVDVVSAQRDGFMSGLYWYTDLEAAKAAAAERDVPILSLRLLGELDEELSCANSRFFRSILYANQDVARFLTQNFVLHWSSERPAPVVRVDMGEGRTLVRTVTGNSAHYVLDAQGRVADVLPGLFTPAEFMRLLARSKQIAGRCAEADDRTECMHAEHTRAQADAEQRWAEVAGDLPLPIRPRYAQLSLGGPFTQDAEDINRLTMSKRLSERDILAIVSVRQGLPDPNPGTPWWERLGPELPTDLDAYSLAMIRLKSGDGFEAQRDSIRLATSQDSLRNEYVMHRDVHRYLARADIGALTFESVNEWLYTTVFRTPQSDAWMGLVNDAVYQALEVE